MADPVPLYDRIGTTYATSRRADPRIAQALRAALGDAETVLNVGAGTGAYEPADLDVIALEPSSVMIAQRPEGSARVIQGVAERIPLHDDSVDAAMAVISDHHWADRAAGLRELRRVARRRVVILNSDPALAGAFWMTRDYLPGFLGLIPPPYREPGRWERELARLLGPVTVRPVPLPHDCLDGFYHAYWRRPRAYLDDEVRNNISVFRRLPVADVRDAVDRLRRDLDDGTWQERHGALMGRPELDLGLRIVVAEHGAS
ncbi:MAG TPA: methyltransferase domain-containing protein [Baekduia sp.]|nr:methyltransferase domain-containing protein [Baekduia sp.]